MFNIISYSKVSQKQTKKFLLLSLVIPTLFNIPNLNATDHREDIGVNLDNDLNRAFLPNNFNVEDYYKEGVRADSSRNLASAIQNWQYAVQDPNSTQGWASALLAVCEEKGLLDLRSLENVYEKLRAFVNPRSQNGNPLDPAHYQELLQPFRERIDPQTVTTRDLIDSPVMPAYILNDPYRLFIVGKCFKISSLWNRERRSSDLNLRAINQDLETNYGQRFDGNYPDNTISGNNAVIFNGLYLTDPDLLMAKAFYELSAQRGCSFAKAELGAYYDHKLAYLRYFVNLGERQSLEHSLLTQAQTRDLQNMINPENLREIEEQTRNFYQNIFENYQNDDYIIDLQMIERARALNLLT